jgi:hypothetical protein
MPKTLTVTMTIELPESVTDYGSSAQAAVMVLRDALCEFEGHRLPTKAYLDRRYPASEGYEWLNRERKAKQLNERIMLARALSESLTTKEEE